MTNSDFGLCLWIQFNPQSVLVFVAAVVTYHNWWLIKTSVLKILISGKKQTNNNNNVKFWEKTNNSKQTPNKQTKLKLLIIFELGPFLFLFFTWLTNVNLLYDGYCLLQRWHWLLFYFKNRQAVWFSPDVIHLKWQLRRFGTWLTI